MRGLLLLALTCVLLVSCETEQLDSNEEQVTKVETLSDKIVIRPNAGNRMESVFRVGNADLLSILAAKVGHKTRSMGVVSHSIDPIVLNGDTIMFLVNFENGWRLYSVDKRMPIILAENTETTMTSQKILSSKALSEWIGYIAEQVRFLKNSNFFDEHSESLEEWSLHDSQILRVASDEYNPDENDWMPYYTEEKGSEVIERSHLLNTAWHQTYPFNSLAPYKVGNIDQRCPAGCGAVAVAQFLYYLNGKKGMGIKMPTEGNSYGVPNNFTINFSNMQDTRSYTPAWTDNYYLYSDDEFKLAALMIAYVGDKLGTKYSNAGSTVTISDMRGYLAQLGIKTAYKDVDENLLYSLCDFWALPSILAADSTNVGGHLWLCDGVKYTIEHYDEVWANISDSAYHANGCVIPPGTKLKRVSKTRRKNQMFQMNWGRNEQADPNMDDVDKTYYSVKDNWCGFNRRRKMIYTSPLVD